MQPPRVRPRPRSYQDRDLPRPELELLDQGLAFDLQTMLGRRTLLRTLGLGAVALGLAACESGAPSDSASGTPAAASPSPTATGGISEIPDETAGPYPGDGSNGPDILQRSGVVRRDLRSSFGGPTGIAEGVPMTLHLTLTDLAADTALTGAAVYVWHCDRAGRYSLYSQGITDQDYLRGVQISDAAGRVTFTSIFPATYPGRWPHIHFEVYPDRAGISDSSNAIATSQVALPQQVCDTVYQESGYERSIEYLAQLSLSTDNVFGDDRGRHQLATVTGDVSTGYQVSLAVGVDSTTTPRGGNAPGGAGGPPDGGPGASPPAGGPGDPPAPQVS